MQGDRAAIKSLLKEHCEQTKPSQGFLLRAALPAQKDQGQGAGSHFYIILLVARQSYLCG